MMAHVRKFMLGVQAGNIGLMGSRREIAVELKSRLYFREVSEGSEVRGLGWASACAATAASASARFL
jgi:hypothetical protein